VKRIAAKLTYANVMATIAVFIALGGASYAATELPRDSVGTEQLQDGAVTGAKIKVGTLPASDLTAAARSFTKAESNARYLGRTRTFTSEIAPVLPNSYRSGRATCPEGFEATGGGVFSSDPVAGKVTASIPLDGGLPKPGPGYVAHSWFGTISAQGEKGVTSPSLVSVICSRVE
jgi:hypothetical protein